MVIEDGVDSRFGVGLIAIRDGAGDGVGKLS